MMHPEVAMNAWQNAWAAEAAWQQNGHSSPPRPRTRYGPMQENFDSENEWTFDHLGPSGLSESPAKARGRRNCLAEWARSQPACLPAGAQPRKAGGANDYPGCWDPSATPVSRPWFTCIQPT